MVYDVPRNFIGDTHYQDAGSAGLEEGDELTLERTGILIQIGERLETQQTDISGILAKRAPKPIEGTTVGIGAANTASGSPSYLQPRSANIVPRTPVRWAGWTGRAQVPQRSPYEEQRPRAVAEDQLEKGRPEKRQRRDDDEHVPLWEVLKMSKPPRRKDNTTQGSVTPMWVRTVDARANGKPARSATSAKKGCPDSQGRLKVKEVIDITSSADDSPVTVDTPRSRVGRGGVYNSSPTKETPEKSTSASGHQLMMPPQPGNRPLNLQPVQPQLNVTKEVTQIVRKEPAVPVRPVVEHTTGPGPREQHEDLPHGFQPSVVPAEQAPPKAAPLRAVQQKAHVKVPNARPPLPATIPSRATVRDPPRMSSPPVSTTNHLSSGTNDHNTTVNDTSETRLINNESALPKLAKKPLRLGVAAPRKMLLCESHDIIKTITPPRPQERILPSAAPLSDKFQNRTGVNGTKQQNNTTTHAKQGAEFFDIDITSLDFELTETPPSVSHKPPLPANEPRFINSNVNVAKPNHNLDVEQQQQREEPTIPREKEPHQRFKKTPLDYSHLDAQLLRSAPPQATVNAIKNIPAAAPPTTKAPVSTTAKPTPLAEPAKTIPPIPTVAATTTTNTAATKPLANQALPNPTTEPLPNPTTKPLPKPTTNPLHPLHRPFRRHTSDTTHLLPSKPSTTTTHDIASRFNVATKKSSGPLRRAETISGGTTALVNRLQSAGADKGGGVVGAVHGRGLGAAGMGVEVEIGGKGPWSEEAWDLFGWVPVGKVVG